LGVIVIRGKKGLRLWNGKMKNYIAISGEILFVTYIYAMKLIIGEKNLIKHFWILNKLEIMQKAGMIFA
jgi:hypothetical protein